MMNNLRLLLAEDDLAMAALLEEYLTDAGYHVSVYHRGDDALKALEQEQFDLILSDVVMPGADGLAILAAAKGDPARTLIVLMTGYSGIEDALDAVGQGAYDFVSKPFQLPEIRVRLDNAARYQALLRRCSTADGDAPLIPEDNYVPFQDDGTRSVQDSEKAAVRAYGIVRE